MSGRPRDQRGAVLPSPVVILSIVAVALAAVAFVVTRGGEPDEREITTASQQSTAPTEETSAPEKSPTTEPPEPTKTPEPVRRGDVYVVVFNNTSTAGLASEVAAEVGEVGWNVVGADNWYGTIPATTVYFPPQLRRAADQLALDLGIERTAPAVEPMQMDRLTIILTGPLG